jgi:hypothetical protein
MVSKWDFFSIKWKRGIFIITFLNCMLQKKREGREINNDETERHRRGDFLIRARLSSIELS